MYKTTKAKISKELVAKAPNALEKQHWGISSEQKQQDSAALFIFLDKKDDEVKAAMDAFQSVTHRANFGGKVGSSHKKKADNGGNGKTRAHCKKPGHVKDNCYELHPEKRPSWRDTKDKKDKKKDANKDSKTVLLNRLRT
ncbi:hypothetical protein LTR12_012403 [Friedmanniomyces endolithicus]|nr:hypothetical protein LTR12_012403 [Friedmanniomyces endolithicus]